AFLRLVAEQVHLPVSRNDLAAAVEQQARIEQAAAVALHEAPHVEVGPQLPGPRPQGLHRGPVDRLAVFLVAGEREIPAGPELGEQDQVAASSLLQPAEDVPHRLALGTIADLELKATDAHGR